MITDAIIDFFFSVVSTILDLLPTPEVPVWLTDAGPVGTVMQYAGSMGAWFPSALAVTIALAVLTAWGVGFAIKALRIVASFFTAGGGSAA